MTIKALLIFTAVGTTFILGITGIGWFYFYRWYMDEKTNGRRQIDTQKAELLRQKLQNRNSQNRDFQDRNSQD